MHSYLPILIMADIPDIFCLADLKLSDQAAEVITLTPSRYQSRDKLEAMIGGMSFSLIHLDTSKIDQTFMISDMDHIFCAPLSKKIPGIGIALGEHIMSAKHSKTVNRALLQLARHVGQSLNAASIVWQPAQLHIGFDYFVGATDHYIAGGPFPVLAQIAISETAKGQFQTSGLSYFSDQEIRISAPAGYAPNEVIKRLVRIAHDIATNGKIETKTTTDGFISGETLFLNPQDNGQSVEVIISASETRHLN